MADFLFSDIVNQNLRSGTDIIQTSGRDAIGVAAWRYVSDALATAALQFAHPRFVARSSNGRYWRALSEAGRISVETGGAKGDGITDDGPTIRATFAYAGAIGARGAIFGAARYRAEPILPPEQMIVGAPPVQLITSAGIHDFGGTTFTRQIGGRGLVYHPANVAPIIDLPLAGNVIAGTREFTLLPGGGASLAIGDTVLWQLGEVAYDIAETNNWSIAVVEAVSGDTVRLDRPCLESLTLTAVTGANKRLRKVNVLRDHVIRDLTLAEPGPRMAYRSLAASESGSSALAAETSASGPSGRNTAMGLLSRIAGRMAAS